jgi:hypothetical protein
VDKVKKVFAVIGAVLTVIICTFFLVFLRRRDSDGQGSSGIDERDSRIQEGLDGAEESIKRSRDTATRCEEHLRRAEEILRNAIKRGEEEKH